MHETLTTVGDRLEIVELPKASATTSFADDVRAGLSATNKSLPSKYFYDDLGSALFDAITRLPEYYPTRAETEILAQWGWEMVRALGETVEFLELGSGSAVKTRLLIEEALRVQRTLKYSPIDISIDALRGSAASLVNAYPDLRVRAYAGDYFQVLKSGALTFEHRVLAMLMGSNIGNYEPAQALELLRMIASPLRPGDGLLLGTDMKKDRATLELAYNDPTGVTAAFDKNVLGRINRELGGTFDLNDFRHVAVYDEERGVVESFLEAQRAHHVDVRSLGVAVRFVTGERIHTESSYKFAAADIAALARVAGFRVAKAWHDSQKRFAIHLLVRQG